MPISGRTELLKLHSNSVRGSYSGERRGSLLTLETAVCQKNERVHLPNIFWSSQSHLVAFSSGFNMLVAMEMAQLHNNMKRAHPNTALITQLFIQVWLIHLLAGYSVGATGHGRSTGCQCWPVKQETSPRLKTVCWKGLVTSVYINTHNRSPLMMMYGGRLFA